MNSQKIAFEQLYLQLAPRLVSFAKTYLHSDAEAENVVQDCFIAVWEKRDSLVFDLGLKSYLYQAVRNKSLNEIKRSMRHAAETYEFIAEVETVNPSPLEQFSKKETEELIHKSITNLPPKCRRVFLLSRQEQMSYKEIATLLDINPKTVENQIAIALKSIREQMGIKRNSEGKNFYLPSILFLF